MDGSLPAPVAAGLAQASPGATGVLFVNLGALRRNYRKLRRIAATSTVAAVVKANAYGTGAAETAKALAREDCKHFFVATLKEAETLRSVLPGKEQIYVLDGLLPGTAAQFATFALTPVLGNHGEFEEWASFAQARKSLLPAVLHFDTGMNRLGFNQNAARDILSHPALAGSFDSPMLMTHLACADDPCHPKNAEQLSIFAEIVAFAPEAAKRQSIANSAGIFLGDPFRLGLVRPGIALYGGRATASGPNPMEPVVFLFTRILQVRWVESGETVGYGATQTLKRRTKIATAAAGYADGFFRAASATDFHEGPPGYIASHRLPLLGRISMDLVTFDATDVPDPLVYRGGFIEVLGQRVLADDFAAFAGTLSYEVLTSLGRRYDRVYFDD
jgi:alanine racemase